MKKYDAESRYPFDVFETGGCYEIMSPVSIMPVYMLGHEGIHIKWTNGLEGAIALTENEIRKGDIVLMRFESPSMGTIEGIYKNRTWSQMNEDMSF